ncbi:rhodanese-like domain-containing protein [Jannaschia seohaensis]|uniref:Rhodanese-related sulfurtransferase n=1 Tax=Jannaschia seohaensis TaxID=475081 RepID=A0A2Y9B469_9RHOB|nr:rhodanese-like domain-containing protein [Jannaschia seohaensis]PWJ13785.1 rhodanese-related sulfurtransferase [Jannaschia seohaensis]SSA50298.1 Rhodanese-related sulfurtransferase [Jannaschia seohaensis]
MTELTDGAHPLRRRFLLALGGGLVSLAAGTAMVLRRDRFAGDQIAPPELLEAVRAGDMILIDIRRPDEWAGTGIAEGAHPLDMRRDDFIPALEEITGGARDVPVALICARGVRSNRMSARLAEAGFTRIVDVPEGMLGSAAGPGWLARDLPVTRP